MSKYQEKELLIIYPLCLNCLSKGETVIFVSFLFLAGTELTLNVCKNFYKSIFFHSKGYHCGITQPLYLNWVERMLMTGFEIKIWIRLSPEPPKWILEFHSYSVLFVIHTFGNQGSFRTNIFCPDGGLLY